LTTEIQQSPVKVEPNGQSPDTLQSLKTFLRDNQAQFKSPSQEAALTAALSRQNDLFVRLPTGSGKSLIYQLPAFMERNQGLVSIILSPLRALIEDQVQSINTIWPNMACKINSELLSSSISPSPLLYIHYNDYYDNSPASKVIEKLIASDKLARIVFDEAQTIILWDDFTTFKQTLPLIRTSAFPLIFLSGSASPVIIDKCMELFSLPRPRIIYDAAPRKNLRYTVTQTDIQAFRKIEYHDRMIVFVSQKSFIDSIANQVQQSGNLQDVQIAKYHGGMSAEDKDANQKKWIETDGCVMIATLAFALGIDFPNVRYVYVLGTAYGLDNLIQMFGRAGRDGKISECFYYFSNHDKITSSSRERRLLSIVQENIQCVR
jgi:superfamily II DNA helicase RecQ